MTWQCKRKAAVAVLTLTVVAIVFPLALPVSAASLVGSAGCGGQSPLSQGDYPGGVWGSSPSDLCPLGADGTIAHRDIAA